MSDSTLRQKFIEAMAATIELYDVVLQDQLKMIERLSRKVDQQQERIEKLEQQLQQWLAERREQAV